MSAGYWIVVVGMPFYAGVCVSMMAERVKGWWRWRHKS